MKRLVVVALLLCPTFACNSRSEPARESVPAVSNGVEVSGQPAGDDWVLAIYSHSETRYVGTSKGDGAYEFSLPEAGTFGAQAVLRLREYPRRQAGCTILSSSGLDETPLHLFGNRDGDRVHFRELAPARQIELTMECDELIVTDTTPIEASEHEFDMILRDGETYEYRPRGEAPGRTEFRRYTLKSRAFVEARIRARGGATLPIEICTPTAAAQRAIQGALELRNFATAIDLGSKALGLDRLGREFSIECDGSIVDPDKFAGSSEEAGGILRIALGPSALQDAPILLSTMLHEVVGHGVLGASEHDPAYATRWEVEEIIALQIEANAAATLGLTPAQIDRITKELARRRKALKERDPELEALVDSELETTAYVHWVAPPVVVEEESGPREGK